MRQLAHGALLLIVTLVGCATRDESTGSSTTTPREQVAGPTDPLGVEAAETEFAEDPDPERTIALTPKNTQIKVVDPAKGEDDPSRSWVVDAVSGTVIVRSDQLKTIVIQIDTTSLFTNVHEANGHLKGQELIDVIKYPKVTVASTMVESLQRGRATVVGVLNMLGTTEMLTFPATVEVADVVTVNAEFALKGTVPGMSTGAVKVDRRIALSVSAK